jgi:hypothetical protein
VFIATKEDLLEENEATGKLLRQSLLAKLKEVEMTVGKMIKKPKDSDTLGQSAINSEIATNPPNVLFTSSTSPFCPSCEGPSPRSDYPK